MLVLCVGADIVVTDPALGAAKQNGAPLFAQNTSLQHELMPRLDIEVNRADASTGKDEVGTDFRLDVTEALGCDCKRTRTTSSCVTDLN